MPSMDLQTGEDFALPRTPIDQPSAVWTRARAFAPVDHEQEAFRLLHPRPTLGGLDAPSPT